MLLGGPLEALVTGLDPVLRQMPSISDGIWRRTSTTSAAFVRSWRSSTTCCPTKNLWSVMMLSRSRMVSGSQPVIAHALLLEDWQDGVGADNAWWEFTTSRASPRRSS